jgi:hypothetical protein
VAVIAAESVSLSNRYIILHIVRKKLWRAKVPGTGKASNYIEEERPGSINGRV